MPKYRDYFRKMLDANKQEFEEFAVIHGKYALDKSAWQEEFNKTGALIVDIVREWESRLCGKSERGNHAVFSANLADKFQSEVKAFFPLIDFVGVEVVRGARETQQAQDDKVAGESVATLSSEDEDDFVIKKLL